MPKHEEDLKVYQDATARWTALSPEGRAKHQAWDYSWRTPEASRAAVDYIRRELHANPGSSSRVEPGILEDGRASLFDVVVDADGKVLGAFNDTFLCPPWCK